VTRRRLCRSDLLTVLLLVLSLTALWNLLALAGFAPSLPLTVNVVLIGLGAAELYLSLRWRIDALTIRVKKLEDQWKPWTSDRSDMS
jgi:hypothetical protein